MTKPELARTLLSRHGKCASQTISDWTGEFELPSQLADFYRDVVDDCSIRPIYIEILTCQLTEFLGDRVTAESALEMLEWC